mmetsp:Transcript_286/g.936  ORF Transcript_286/g.936 Transcript_286/m.936 type:complete len:483 (-) Transcript_286:192-1640(-)
MWFLVNAGKDGKEPTEELYWLGGIDSGGRSVGRKNADILLKRTCVSRTHAKLLVESKPGSGEGSECETRVCIVDTSAFGTYVNYNVGEDPNRRLYKENSIVITSGACLAFGAPISWFVLKELHICVLLSELPSAVQDRICMSALASGFRTRLSMSEAVTHVVIERIKRCPAVFMALVKKWILVTPQWISALARNTVIRHASSLSAIPDDSLYSPPLEKELERFETATALQTADRRSLFVGFSFNLPPSIAGAQNSIADVLREAGGNVHVDGTAAADFAAFNYEGKLRQIAWSKVEDAILENDSSILLEEEENGSEIKHLKPTVRTAELQSDAETEENLDVGGADDDPSGQDSTTPSLVEDGCIRGFKRLRHKHHSSSRPTSIHLAGAKFGREGALGKLPSPESQNVVDVRPFKRRLIPQQQIYLRTARDDELAEEATPSQQKPTTDNTQHGDEHVDRIEDEEDDELFVDNKLGATKRRRRAV